jgi:hypothetical protein
MNAARDRYGVVMRADVGSRLRGPDRRIEPVARTATGCRPFVVMMVMDGPIRGIEPELREGVRVGCLGASPEIGGQKEQSE